MMRLIHGAQKERSARYRGVAPLPETSEAKSVVAAIDIQEPTRKTVRTDEPEPSATVSSTEPYEPTDAFGKTEKETQYQ